MSQQSLREKTKEPGLRSIRATESRSLREPHPVLWALQPELSDLSMIDQIRDILAAWMGKKQKILPVTVLSPFDLAWPLRIDRSIRKKMLTNFSDNLKRVLREKGVNFENVLPLPSESASLRKMASLLIRTAKREKAEILVVGSGAGARSEMTGLGSFSETLIALSPLPVMVVGTQAQSQGRITRIFFPTDLSIESKKVFKKVLQYARYWNAEVILYHHFDLQMGPVMAGPDGIGIDTTWLDTYWDQQKKEKENTGHKWTRLAEKDQLRCTFVADYQLGALKDRMLATTQKAKADLIFVGVKRGPLSQVIFGSVVRHLFAKAFCPVVVLHSKTPR